MVFTFTPNKILVCLLVLFSVNAFSQDYTISAPSNDLNIDVYDSDPWDLEHYISLTNNTSNGIDLFAKREILQLAPNTDHSYCWLLSKL